jgi:transcriptional regulator with XRE-family HTH domain
MDNIGEKIRIQRLIKNYSQEYMAFALDMSQAAYSNIERNETKITLERVFEIAEILEISPFELMPKPKNGTGINAEYFWRTIKKLSGLWTSKVKKRLKNKPEGLNVFNSDISNIDDK